MPGTLQCWTGGGPSRPSCEDPCCRPLPHPGKPSLTVAGSCPPSSTRTRPRPWRLCWPTSRAGHCLRREWWVTKHLRKALKKRKMLVIDTLHYLYAYFTMCSTLDQVLYKYLYMYFTTWSDTLLYVIHLTRYFTICFIPEQVLCKYLYM